MQLAFKKLGSGTPLVILHGMYGSSDNWYSVGKELSQNFEVYLIDQRNHGKSPHSPEHNYSVLQNDLNEFFEEHNIFKSVVMGHSMGGKTAISFAVSHPEKIEKLIVVDIAPKAYKSLQVLDPMSIEHLNIVNAMALADFRQVRSRVEADKELARYIPSERVRQFLLKSVGRDEQGNYYWTLNVEAIRKHLPEILEGIDISRYRPRREEFAFPVLFVKGEKSQYIKDTDFDMIKELFPRAELVTIFGAGHWVQTDQPELFLNTVKRFLLKE